MSGRRVLVLRVLVKRCLGQRRLLSAAHCPVFCSSGAVSVSTGISLGRVILSLLFQGAVLPQAHHPTSLGPLPPLQTGWCPLHRKSGNTQHTQGISTCWPVPSFFLPLFPTRTQQQQSELLWPKDLAFQSPAAQSFLHAPRTCNSGQ